MPQDINVKSEQLLYKGKKRGVGGGIVFRVSLHAYNPSLMWGPNPLWCPLPWLSLPPPNQYYSDTELKDGPEELTLFKYWQERASFTHDLASKLAGGKGLGSALCGLRARSRQGQYLLSDVESEVLRHEPFDAALPGPA